MTWLLWIWANIALLGCAAGIVAAWWYWPDHFPRLPLIALTASLSAFGWGEQRYVDGREAGGEVERIKWERSFRQLEADMESEQRKADAELAKAAENAVLRARERDEAREDARIANARLIAELNADPEPETIQCEKANETVQCPRCRSCYRQRVDPRILRNIAAGRGQD